MNLVLSDLLPKWWCVYIKWADGATVPHALFPSHGQARDLSNKLKTDGFHEVLICRAKDMPPLRLLTDGELRLRAASSLIPS